jgi:tetratricopeptide (TPR) repeat protein
MSSPLPTLNDMLNPQKKQAPQSNPPKEENKIVEEENKVEENVEEKKEEAPQPVSEPPKEENKIEEGENKVEENVEEKKEEGKKEEEPKVEEDPKKKKEAPKVPPKPREPEPKIPTDFKDLIKEITDIKASGNELVGNKSYEEAISKYKEAYDKLEKELPKINHERSYNPQSEELLTLNKQIMSNLSLCYTKTEKYQESIDLDLKIISNDPMYDKSYVRLFKNYKQLNKMEQAVYFGDTLLKFDDDTKNKYKDEIADIEEEKKKLQAVYDKIRAEERKKMLKNFAKYAIPIAILLAAVGIYYFAFKK